MTVKRRDLLKLTTGGLFLNGLPLDAAVFGAETPKNEPAATPGLNALGKRKGVEIGCAVQPDQLVADRALADAIPTECGIIVAENAMKWGVTEQTKGKPDYTQGDIVANYAAKHGLQLRGHTAMWYRSVPNWAKTDLSGPDGRDVALKRVQSVVAHYRGRVVDWDVVNEMIDHQSPLPTGFRNWPPFAPGDPGFIADCFFAAREADPKAILTYNDFGFEYQSTGEDKRRASALKLLDELKRRSAPIDAFSIQAHIKVGNNFKPKVFATFLQNIADHGVTISLTEFDIDDQRLPADIAARENAVAEHGRVFLDAAFSVKAVIKLLTWGFRGSDSWLNAQRPRADGIPHRPLPWDENLSRTPLWQAIADSIKSAPDRRRS